MPLVLKPMTTSDTLSWTRIRALAYRGPTNDLIHTAPPSENTILKVAEDRKNEIGRPNIWHLKIVDTDLPPSESDPADNGGRTITIGIWSLVNMDTTTEAEAETEGSKDLASVPRETTAMETNDSEKPAVSSESTPFLPPELRLDVLTALLSPLREAQLETMGSKSYMMLNTLATHPDHERRGAGSMLVRWGLVKADELDVETYLDTSRAGRALYEKNGFVLVKEVEFDRTVWGGEGVDWHGCMVRKQRNGGQ